MEPGGGPHAKRPFRTLLAEHVGQDYRELGDERGKVRLWHLSHRAGVFESSGSLDLHHAQFIISYFRTHIEPFPRPWYAFGNWMELEAYTPAVRRTLTDWQIEMAYDELYVAHESKLVAMSMNLANSALKNTVTIVNSEEVLDDKLLAVRDRNRF